MADRAAVRNAADPEQVRRAGRKDRDRETRWLLALREVLRTPAGRIVFGDLRHGWIARWGVYRSIWDQSARIHYNAGQQDAAHSMLADIIRADEDAYLLMEREARAYERREDRETDAAHTAAAAEGAVEQ